MKNRQSDAQGNDYAGGAGGETSVAIGPIQAKKTDKRSHDDRDGDGAGKDGCQRETGSGIEQQDSERDRREEQAGFEDDLEQRPRRKVMAEQANHV